MSQFGVDIQPETLQMLLYPDHLEHSKKKTKLDFGMLKISWRNND